MTELLPHSPRLRAILAHPERQPADNETIGIYLRLQVDTVRKTLAAAEEPAPGRRQLPQPQRPALEAPAQQASGYKLEKRLRENHPLGAAIHLADCTICIRFAPNAPAPSSVHRVPGVAVGGIRETVDVAIGYLVVGIELVLGVAIALLFIPGPVQRWWLRFWEGFERLRVASGVRRATPLLTQMPLPPRIRDRVDGHGLTPLYVMRWWRALPLAMPIKTLRFLLLLFVLLNVDDMADWEHLR
ncbi:hypothetical protein [Streptomyces sp. NPDC058755]|uniref:hypothetical protein n=1 Tax=Streptomyces sp. NPDC058755 TaxID=3346624 RepID=UPI003688AA3A